MPLRITIELIPRGDESRKTKLAVVDIENDGTAGDMRGGGDVGNYRVLASAEMQGGYDEFASFTMGPLKRGDYLDTCIDIMSVLHSSRMPRQGFGTGRVEVDHSGHNGKDDPTLTALGQSAGSALCAGCQWIADKPGQWCDMFRDAPEELPCTQHDQFAPIREAMVQSGMAKLVIAAAMIGMPNA